tara:strand:- start:4803 stop:5369 length:567 start_codon:yes stop_codon:yes gene_type:complete
MLKFEITYKSSFCGEWPKIEIKNNNHLIAEVECDDRQFLFDIDPQNTNHLTFEWFNKSQKHTRTNNGKIVEDQTFELCNIRIDGIQIEEWFWTDGFYQPRYFDGFLQQYKDQRRNEILPTEIKSQLIWHFPGIFKFTAFPLDFWDWYFNIKQEREVIKFLDKDPDRIHKFRGSLDPCNELVGKIKNFL